MNSEQLKSRVNRRSFLKTAGGATAALAAAAAAPTFLFAQDSSAATGTMDTPKQIFTAALVAEDLATVFYFNGLVQTAVIQDPNLAGPGGTATHISKTGHADDVGYLRAALNEEMTHANLFRSLLGISRPSGDPFQQFYFPSGTYSSLTNFIATLEALEMAFIGAYLAAITEFSTLASQGRALTLGGTTYQPADLVYFARVSASIMGVEAEHRALGRSIIELIPANNFNYEQTDGITTVYNGSTSAVAALTPFLTPGSGKVMHSLGYALQQAPGVVLATSGNPPAR